MLAAVDIGLRGGWCVAQSFNGAMPNCGTKSRPVLGLEAIGDMCAYWDIIGVTKVYIEKAQTFTRGKKGISSMGRQQGIWEMACVSAGLEYELINPQTWQVLLKGKEGKGNKEKAKLLSGLEHDGAADAWCILEYLSSRAKNEP